MTLSPKSWAVLTNFQSHDLVRRDYLRRHGREANAAHVREICSPFVQGQHYWKSANVADRTVYPLLLYYGVLSLSRGLNLFLTRGLREAALSASHGISIRDWGAEFAKDNPDIANLEIRLNGGGTLKELIAATGNRSLLRHNSSAVNFKHTHIYEAQESELTLGDLLSRLPDISGQYGRWKEKPAGIPFETKTKDDISVFVVRKSKLVTRAAAEEIFAGTEFHLKDENEKTLAYEGPDSTSAAPRLSDKTTYTAFDAGIGDLYLTARFPDKKDISKIALVFCISFVVGMLARYYPAQWLSLIHSQRNDGALPTILSSLEYIETTFPELVLDFLEEQ